MVVVVVVVVVVMVVMVVVLLLMELVLVLVVVLVVVVVVVVVVAVVMVLATVLCMALALVLVHIIWDIDPDEPANMLILVAFEYTQVVPQSSCLNILASMNMPSILITLDTSHLEMSPLNLKAPLNISFIVVT